MDCSPPGSSAHGILQARILEWVAFPFSRGSSWPRDRTWVSRIAGRFLTICATKGRLPIFLWILMKMCLVLSCVWLFVTPARLLYRILEWVAISFSRGSSPSRDWTCVSCIAGRIFTCWAIREDEDVFISNIPTNIHDFYLLIQWLLSGF